MDKKKLFPAVSEYPHNGIQGPTVKYAETWTPGETGDAMAPCHLLGYLVAKSCLDCPLSVCKFDNLSQARAEVKTLAQKGELWKANTEH